MGEIVEIEVAHRLQHRDVDAAATPVRLALVQGAQDAESAA